MQSLVNVNNLEMNVSFACNLKCEYCTHLGRFMKGIVPVEELVSWYKTWNQKISPRNVRVMGGEPLLHPRIIEVITETRNHWKESRVELITNGLLLPRMPQTLFDRIRENGLDVTVSRHFDDPCYNRMFDGCLETLRKNGIGHHVRQSNRYWMKCYRIDEHGNRQPFQSDPQKAWENCCTTNMCTTLINNKLYRCPQLGCYTYAREKGYVGGEWDVVLNYKPLLPGCTQRELQDFMDDGMCDQCGICPEQFEYADMYEKINPFGLMAINKINT